MEFLFLSYFGNLILIEALIQLHVEHRERIICVAKLSLAKPLSSPSLSKTFSPKQKTSCCCCYCDTTDFSLGIQSRKTPSIYCCYILSQEQQRNTKWHTRKKQASNTRSRKTSSWFSMKLWVLEKMVVAVAYVVSSKIMLNALQHLKEFSTDTIQYDTGTMFLKKILWITFFSVFLTMEPSQEPSFQVSCPWWWWVQALHFPCSILCLTQHLQLHPNPREIGKMILQHCWWICLRRSFLLIAWTAWHSSSGKKFYWRLRRHFHWPLRAL